MRREPPQRGQRPELGLAAGVMAAALLLCCACESGTGHTTDDLRDRAGEGEGLTQCVASPDDCNHGRRTPGGTIRIGLVGSTQQLDPFAEALGTGRDVAATSTATLMSLISPAAFVVTPSGKRRFNSNVLTEEPLMVEGSQAGQRVIIYKIRAAARWSDGMPLSARDFEYTWRVQAGKPEIPEDKVAGDGVAPCQTAYCLISAVTGSDNGKTVTVTLDAPTPDWKNLFSAIAPAAVGEKMGDPSTLAGLVTSRRAFESHSGWSGGPYIVSAFEPGHQVEFIPNPAWYGEQKPTLSKVVFRFFDNQESALQALERFEINTLEISPDQPMMSRIRDLGASAVDCQASSGHTTTQVDINTTGTFLSGKALRTAIMIAIDTEDIVNQVVRSILPSATPKLSHHLFPGQTGYTRVLSEVAPQQGSGEVDTARAILAEAGYTPVGGGWMTPDGQLMPTLRLRYVTGTADALIVSTAGLLRAHLERLGLSVSIEPTEDLMVTQSTRDFDLLIKETSDGAFFSTTIDRWRSGAPDNATGWASLESDALLDRAATESDDDSVARVLNQHDQLLTAEAVTLPLYQRPRVLALAHGYVNIRESASGGTLADNAEQWGLGTVGSHQDASCSTS